MGRVAPSAPFPNIYLMGLMGCGKSTVGSILARELQCEFVDLDKLIEFREANSLSQIFLAKGEPCFRAIEGTLLQEVSRKNSCVIALGGGAILRSENRDIIKQTGISIYLEVTPELLLKRLAEAVDRPLLHDLSEAERLKRLSRLASERQSFYEEADLTVSNEKTPHAAVTEILRTLEYLWKQST
jgi:shikimate kinase